jgi:hypothetical protein
VVEWSEECCCVEERVNVGFRCVRVGLSRVREDEVGTGDGWGYVGWGRAEARRARAEVWEEFQYSYTADAFVDGCARMVDSWYEGVVREIGC